MPFWKIDKWICKVMIRIIVMRFKLCSDMKREVYKASERMFVAAPLISVLTCAQPRDRDGMIGKNSPGPAIGKYRIVSSRLDISTVSTELDRLVSDVCCITQ